MSSKTKEQKKARKIQEATGWSYSECLRIANEGMTDEALAILMTLRGVPVGLRQGKAQGTE